MRGLLARGELQVEQRHEWSRWTRWRGTEDAEHVRDADVREGVGRAQELGDAASRPRHQSGCARRAQAQGMVRRSAGSARWRMCRFVAPARGGRRAHSARARLRARGPSTSPSTAACRRRPAAPMRMSRLAGPAKSSRAHCGERERRAGERDSGHGPGEGSEWAGAHRDAKTQLSEVPHAPLPAAGRQLPASTKAYRQGQTAPASL